jgi:peptidoglycan hydrolase-like protein with peptidoglycan-binding domain
VVALRPVAAAAAVCAVLGLLAGCNSDSGVTAADAAPPARVTTTASTVTTLATTTAPATTAAPTTLAAPTTTLPATALPPTTPPTTAACGPEYYAADGMCYPTTTTIPPTTTTTLPPAAPPEPAPPLLAPVTPVRPGASGPQVGALQQRLLDLGFWLDKVDSSYGLATRQAVMAFQKSAGIPASSAVDQRTADALNTAPLKVKARADRGTLIEVDKARQLLFVVQGGRTVWAFNTSTGSGKDYQEQGAKDPTQTFTGKAITPDGWWKVNREHDQGWWDGDLGKIYRPKYFRGGIAVHGMNNVPNQPVSHGCVRVSVPAMDFIWAANLMPIGMQVWVHS